MPANGWLESTVKVIKALETWQDTIRFWQRNGGQGFDGSFDEALQRLRLAGLEGWADTNPDDLDALAGAAEWGEGGEASKD
jgi:hypothetical protein